MGDAADDAYNAAVRREEENEEFWEQIHQNCPRIGIPLRHECKVVPLPLEDEMDVQCVVCKKKFMVEF